MSCAPRHSVILSTLLCWVGKGVVHHRACQALPYKAGENQVEKGLAEQPHNMQPPFTLVRH